LFLPEALDGLDQRRAAFSLASGTHLGSLNQQRRRISHD
jgi:hypothetical protein